MQEDPRHEAILLAHAWRLVDPRVARTGADALDPPSAHGEPPGARELTRRIIQELPLLPEADAERAAQLVLDNCETDGVWASFLDVAERAVAIQGGELVARHDSTAIRLRQLLDVDLLACVHRARSPRCAGNRQVSCAWPAVLPPERSGLSSMLAQPGADLHCHLGSTMSPATLWIMVLCGGQRFGDITPEVDDPTRFLAGWGRLLDDARGTLWVMAEGHRTDPDIQTKLYQKLMCGVPQERPRSNDDSTTMWPLGRSVSDNRVSLSILGGERRICLDCVDKALQGDERARSLLLEYLGLKSAFQGVLLHRPHSRGLKSFQRTFDRRGFYFTGLRPDPRKGQATYRAIEYRRMCLALESALEDAAGVSGPQAEQSVPELDLELRISPVPGPRMLHGLFSWAQAIVDTMERWRHPPLRVGLIVHALKLRRNSWEQDHQAQLRGIWHLMRENPRLRTLVVGLDAAGPERARAPREHLDLFRSARRRIDEQPPGPGGAAWKPGFTFHVGEDYGHLLTGLRNVWEATTLLGLRPGDRLGHALAVGVQPADFYRSQPRVMVEREQHLVDLLWVMHLARQGRIDATHGLTAERLLMALLAPDGLVAKIQRCVSRVGQLQTEQGQAMTERMVIDPLISRLRFPEEPLCVDSTTRGFQAMVEAAQEATWNAVHEANLVIESNPTSNLLIGRFASYADIPGLRMGHAPGRSPGEHLPKLRMTINTDNPGLFQTTLSNEFIRVGEALAALPGVSWRDAERWLKYCRQEAVRHTFIPRWIPRGEGFTRFVKGILAGYEARESK